jgi:endonuclease/exonuclease/phosphatase family metal-dependent hydrolase
MCRIVSYNIHSGIGRDKVQDYRRIGQFLTETGADIVLLQEMDTRPSERAIERDIEDICAGNAFSLVASPALEEESGWYGNAILTRFKLLHHETLDVSQQGRQPRNAQLAVLQTEKGPLTVVNTHKGLKTGERRNQFALLHDFLADRLRERPSPLVLAGDFNEWQFFTRAFNALNSLLNQQRIGPTFPSQFPLFSLDRVWTSEGIKTVACKKLTNAKARVFSDHLPIQLDIRLPEAEPVE